MKSRLGWMASIVVGLLAHSSALAQRYEPTPSSDPALAELGTLLQKVLIAESRSFDQARLPGSLRDIYVEKGSSAGAGWPHQLSAFYDARGTSGTADDRPWIIVLVRDGAIRCINHSPPGPRTCAPNNAFLSDPYRELAGKLEQFGRSMTVEKVTYVEPKAVPRDNPTSTAGSGSTSQTSGAKAQSPAVNYDFMHRQYCIEVLHPQSRYVSTYDVIQTCRQLMNGTAE